MNTKYEQLEDFFAMLDDYASDVPWETFANAISITKASQFADEVAPPKKQKAKRKAPKEVIAEPNEEPVQETPAVGVNLERFRR